MLIDFFAGPIFSPIEAALLTVLIYAVIILPGVIFLALGIRDKRRQLRENANTSVKVGFNFKIGIGIILMVLPVLMLWWWSSLRSYEQLFRYDGTYYSLNNKAYDLNAVNVNLVGYREVTTRYTLASGESVVFSQQAKTTDDDGVGLISDFAACKDYRKVKFSYPRNCEKIKGLQDQAFMYSSRLYIDKGENIIMVGIETESGWEEDTDVLLAAAKDVHEASISELFLPVLSKWDGTLRSY